MDKKISFEDKLQELESNIKVMQEMDSLTKDITEAISYLDKKEKKESK